MMPRTDASLDLAASLLAANDPAARAAMIALAVVDALPDCACVVHRFLLEDGNAVWNAVALAGDVSVENATLPGGSLMLEPLLEESPEPAIYTGGEIQREDYAHLHMLRSVISLAYVPISDGGQLAGAIEVLAFAEVL